MFKWCPCHNMKWIIWSILKNGTTKFSRFTPPIHSPIRPFAVCLPRLLSKTTRRAMPYSPWVFLMKYSSMWNWTWVNSLVFNSGAGGHYSYYYFWYYIINYHDYFSVAFIMFCYYTLLSLLFLLLWFFVVIIFVHFRSVVWAVMSNCVPDSPHLPTVTSPTFPPQWSTWSDSWRLPNCNRLASTRNTWFCQYVGFRVFCVIERVYVLSFCLLL